jgi:maltokinase
MHITATTADGAHVGVPAVLQGDMLRRAVPGDGVAEALVRMLEPGGSVSGAPPVESAFDVDQTDDVMVVDDRVVKWALHPSADDVAAVRLEALAAGGFDGTPALRGIARSGGRVVALVTDLVPGAQDGWQWAVDDVRACAQGVSRAADRMGAECGALVGRLHVTLAAGGRRPARAEDVDRWWRRARADASNPAVPSEFHERVEQAIAPIRHAAGTPICPTHGDLHVGQLLRGADGRLHVIDFDGNPVLPADERGDRQPTARDVAGMLASLDHVARVVLHRTTDLTGAQRDRVLAWIPRAQDDFLSAYRAQLGQAGMDDLLDATLLRPFQVQQECREYAYAAQFLPHWRYVPDAALPALLDRGDW